MVLVVIPYNVNLVQPVSLLLGRSFSTDLCTTSSHRHLQTKSRAQVAANSVPDIVRVAVSRGSVRADRQTDSDCVTYRRPLPNSRQLAVQEFSKSASEKVNSCCCHFELDSLAAAHVPQTAQVHSGRFHLRSIAAWQPVTVWRKSP